MSSGGTLAKKPKSASGEETTSSCLLCTEPLDASEKSNLPCCTFDVCKECTTKWLSTCIMRGLPARCPSGTCPVFTSEQLEQTALLDGELLNIAVKRSEERASSERGASAWAWLPTLASLMDNVLSSIWRMAHCRQCPSCKVACIKEGGCDHVICTLCGCSFCWQCGRKQDAFHGEEFACVPFKRKLCYAAIALATLASLATLILWDAAHPVLHVAVYSVSACSSLASIYFASRILSAAASDTLYRLWSFFSASLAIPLQDRKLETHMQSHMKSAAVIKSYTHMFVATGATAIALASMRVSQQAGAGQWDVVCASALVFQALALFAVHLFLSLWEAVCGVEARLTALHAMAAAGEQVDAGKGVTCDATGLLTPPGLTWRDGVEAGALGILYACQVWAFAYCLQMTTSSIAPQVAAGSLRRLWEMAAVLAAKSPPYVAVCAALAFLLFLVGASLRFMVSRYQRCRDLKNRRLSLDRLRGEVARGRAFVGPMGFGDEQEQGVPSLFAEMALPGLALAASSATTVIAGFCAAGHMWPGCAGCFPAC